MIPCAMLGIEGHADVPLLQAVDIKSAAKLRGGIALAEVEAPARVTKTLFGITAAAPVQVLQPDHAPRAGVLGRILPAAAQAVTTPRAVRVGTPRGTLRAQDVAVSLGAAAPGADAALPGVKETEKPIGLAQYSTSWPARRGGDRTDHSQRAERLPKTTTGREESRERTTGEETAGTPGGAGR